MDDEQKQAIRELVREYLKENLTVSISTDTVCDWGTNYLVVKVYLDLEGETISEYRSKEPLGN